jgi:general stress protein YciG
MAGTKTGGQKAAAKNLAKDPLFYAKIGKIGGQKGTTGGFAANRELAKIAGAIGGRVSRRKKATVTTEA